MWEHFKMAVEFLVAGAAFFFVFALLGAVAAASRADDAVMGDEQYRDNLNDPPLHVVRPETSRFYDWEERKWA